MSKETRNLILFLVATIAATYAAYFTIILNGWSPYEAPGLIFFLIGGSAPTWIGLLLVLFVYNKNQRGEYFKRLSPRLIAGRWWVVILLVFPLIFAAVLGINLLLGGTLPGMTELKDLIAQPAVLPLVLLLGLGSGPISEEFGWRGVALDPLMKRFGRIAGTAALGLMWGVWHLPLFFMPQTWHGGMGFRFAGFFTFVLMSVGLSWVMSWVHCNTGGSILAAILMHFFSNFTSSVLGPSSDQVEIIHMAVMLVVGLGLCLWMERRSPRPVTVGVGG
jgi:membrane protease YdiL (CAAX protease family)